MGFFKIFESYRNWLSPKDGNNKTPLDKTSVKIDEKMKEVANNIKDGYIEAIKDEILKHDWKNTQKLTLLFNSYVEGYTEDATSELLKYDDAFYRVYEECEKEVATLKNKINETSAVTVNQTGLLPVLRKLSYEGTQNWAQTFLKSYNLPKNLNETQQKTVTAIQKDLCRATSNQARRALAAILKQPPSEYVFSQPDASMLGALIEIGKLNVSDPNSLKKACKMAQTWQDTVLEDGRVFYDQYENPKTLGSALCIREHEGSEKISQLQNIKRNLEEGYTPTAVTYTLVSWWPEIKQLFECGVKNINNFSITEDAKKMINAFKSILQDLGTRKKHRKIKKKKHAT